MSDFLHVNKSSKPKSLTSVLERLVGASESGNFDLRLNADSLDPDDAEAILLIGEALSNYKAATEYNLLKYRLTSESLGIALWDMDVVDGDPINPLNKFTWSQEFRVMLGFSGEHDFPNLLHSWSDRLHPEDKEKTLHAFAAHLSDRTGKTPYDVTYRLMMKNGEYRYFHAFGTTLRGTEGIPLRVAGALEDVDAKMQTQKWVQLMLEALPIGCTLWDKHFMFIDCNPATVRMFGVESKKQFAQKFKQLSPEYQPDGQRSADARVKVVAEAFKDGYKQFEWVHQTLDGTPIPCEITLVRVKHDRGFSVASFIRDLREHKRMQEALREAYDRSRILLDTTPLCCQLWDRNGRMIDCNEEAVKLFGLQNKQEFLDDFYKFSPEYQPNGQRTDEMAAELLKEAFETGRATFDWVYNMSDGTTMPAEGVVVRIKYKDDFACAVYTRDLREHHRMMHDIEDRDKLLSAANEASALLIDLNAESFEDSLMESMRIIAEAVDVHHVGVWKNFMKDGRIHYFLLQDWVSELRPPITDSYVTEIPYDGFLHGLYESLSQGNVYTNHVSNMPPEDQAQLSPQWIKSIYATPIFVKDKFWGFVGFDDCVKAREFTENEAMILRSTGRLIGNAFYRHAAERQQKEMVVEIQHRDELLSAANKASALLLDTNADSFEDTLAQSMRVIAEAVDVHRICIWKNYEKDGNMHCFLIQEWISERRPPVSGEFSTDTPFLPGWYEILSQDKCLMNNVDRMSPSEQEQLKPQRIQSLFVTPVFVKDVFWGYVGFDDCLRARDFTENETMILRATGRFIGSAFYRYNMEREIAETRERYDRMLDASPIGSTLWRQDLTIIDCSEANVNLYGVKNKQEYIEKFHTLSPEYQPNGKRSADEAKRLVDTAFAEGRVVFEWMHQKPDGTPLPSEVTLVRVEYGDGYAVVGYTRDLREHARMEEALHEAYDRSKLLLDTTPLCCQLWDRNGRMIDCNEEAVKLFGLKNKQEFIKEFYKFSPEHQMNGRRTDELVAELLEEAFTKGRGTFDWVYLLADGTLMPAEGVLVRIKYKDDYAVAVYTRDLRERMQMEDDLRYALHESNRACEVLTSIMNESGAMIYVTELGTDETLFITDSMRQHYGIEGEVIGQPCWKVLQTGMEKRCDFCPCYQLDKEPDKVIVWEEHSPLTQCYYRNIDRYVDWPGGKKVHIQFSADVTEIKRAQVVLERREKMLTALNKMSAILLSHENATFSDTMTRGLKPISDAAGVDRVAVYKRLDKESARLGQVYLWHGETIPLDNNPLDNEMFVLPENPPVIRWLEILRNSEGISADVSKMPEDESAFWGQFGAKTIYFGPVIMKGDFWGVVTLEDHTRYRTFDEDCSDLMQSAAHMCADVIIRSEMERNMADRDSG